MVINKLLVFNNQSVGLFFGQYSRVCSQPLVSSAVKAAADGFL